MRIVPRAILITILCLTAACAPKMRIKPGELPPAEMPEASLRQEAEQYAVAHINEQNYSKIEKGPGVTRVTKIIERLSKAAGYPPKTFPVHLVDAGEDANAAAINGASIIVYKALIDRVPADEELATVLSHEIGHIICKHYKDQEEEQSRAQSVGIASSILGTVASVATSAVGYGGVSDLAGDVTETTTGLVGYGAFVGSFSRVQEYEADHIGLLVMAKAGYDPAAAPRFWNRAEEIFGSDSTSVGAFFSTHPASSDRLKALEEAMPYAQSMYRP